MGMNNNNYNKQLLQVEHEFGDIIFVLLWIATIDQIGLILWDWFNVTPFIRTFWALKQPNSIKAIELSTSAYLALQLAYMGKKEFTRWLSARSSATVLEQSELASRLQRAEMLVFMLGLIYISAVLTVALHVTERMPDELERTFLQVVSLYTLAFVSKAAFTSRIKQQARANHPSVNTDLNIGMDQSSVASERSRKLLELIKSKDIASAKDCMDELNLPKLTVNRMLHELVESNTITRIGKGKNTVYKSKPR
jgi:hypothetical protein